MAFLHLKPGGIHQRGHLGKKEGGRNILPPFGVLKSLAEFTARRRQSRQIIFCCDMCVGKNIPQAASVQFVRLQHTNYARSRLQAFCRKIRRLFRQFRGINIPLPAPRR